MSFLSIPTKKGTEVDIIKPVKQYIKANYGDGQAEACSKGLAHLQSLRNQILLKLNDRHESTSKLISEYVDLLSLLEQRIPITNQDVTIQFKWFDCFSTQSLFSNDSMKGGSAGFERCCMLFNLASVNSQIGASENINDDQGLRTAAKTFQMAAGLFQYVKSTLPTYYSQSPTWDMCAESLDAYHFIMLAQAQESIFKKAEKDEMKAAIIAKIASHASSLYNDALKSISLASIKSYMPKDWAGYMSFKANYLEVQAEYYRSVAAADEHKYGEQLARLTKASGLLKNISSRTQKDIIRQLTELIKNTYTTAKKDNDLIYHDVVPDHKNLLPIGVAVVAKKSEITFPLSGKSVRDVFSVLVPIAVHSALSVAEGVCQSMISVELGRLREATDVCNSTLMSLNLPAAIQETTQDQIPSSLLEKAAKVRSLGGLDSLRGLMNSLATGSTRNEEILQNIVATLDEEEKTDDDLRKKYGEKWNRQHSARLTESWRSEISKHQNLLQQASNTDTALSSRFNENEGYFEKLCFAAQDLMIALRSSSDGSSSPTPMGGTKDRKKLLELCSRVDSMKEYRQDLMKQIQDFKLPTEIRERYLKITSDGGSIDAVPIANECINADLQSVRECIRESLDSQNDLIRDIQNVYEKVFGTKKADVSLSTTLCMAGEVFEQLTSDLNQGVNFYADLTGILVKFQSKVDDFAFARKTEKSELMKDITKELSVSDGSTAAPARPPPTYQSSQPSPNAAAPLPQAATAPPPANMYQQSQPGIPPQSMYWPGYGMPPPGAPQMNQMPQMPMYGMYGGYPVPMYYPPHQQFHGANQPPTT